jgi:hypothetical protein
VTALESTLRALASGATPWKYACRVVATSNVAIATGGLLTIDGVVLAVGDRVLLAGQTSAAQNGIYQVRSTAWVRATDADDATDLQLGMTVRVLAGTAYAGSTWALTSPTTGTISRDVTALTFALTQLGASAPLPANATIIRPSGDTTGVTDRAAVEAVVSAGRVAVLESAGMFYDDGDQITWHANGRVITTDGRPAFWNKGSAATTSMNALPGCINTSGATITMNLPPAANWADQYITCEATASVTVTVDPNSTETIGAATSLQIGNAERLTVTSRGTSKLVPTDGGTTTAPRVYAGSLFSPEEQLFLRPGPYVGGVANEMGNEEHILGRLRTGVAFANGSAIVLKDTGGIVWRDEQIFGTGSATGYLYWRVAYLTGCRTQMTGATTAGEDYVLSANGAAIDLVYELGLTTTDFRVVAAAASGAVNNLFVDGDGSVIIASVSGQEVQIRSGSTVRIETNGTGIGFFAATPVAKPSVSGSRGGNAALASLLTALANLGLITDGSSA